MIPFFRAMLDHEELPSTSDLAREVVAAGEVELPFVVRARKQTSGRGRGDHRWFSDVGSLTFTIAIDPTAHGLRRDHESRLALVAALSVIDVLETSLPRGTLAIRWPNDVEAEGRKLAGILPERVETDAGPRLLIGTGLNVSTRLEEAPADIRAMATSVRALGATDRNADAIFLDLLAGFPPMLKRLAEDDPALALSWAGRDSLFGRRVSLQLGSTIITGRGAGIDATGGLRIADALGTRLYHGGQVLRDPTAHEPRG